MLWQARFSCCNRFCLPRVWWGARLREAQTELRYAMLRDRFVAPLCRTPKEEPLPDDFEFAGYLRRRAADVVVRLLDVGVAAWVALLLVLAAAVEAPAWLPQLTGAPLFAPYGTLLVLGAAVALWLLCQLVEAHLRRVLEQLTPVYAA